MFCPNTNLLSRAPSGHPNVVAHPFLLQQSTQSNALLYKASTDFLLKSFAMLQ